ncbi:hypothetical protein [Actinopolyspora halophila]|uniref:hypothetical protein n=1 Tax=Actinopolyspora halophila TaxID=1850 RepID=UPI000362FBAD|nr:hypothetical protein [Actinopolyspora halophila]
MTIESEKQTSPEEQAPQPVLNPDTAEGAAIAELYRRLKTVVEEPDGSWPGGDVVNELNQWLAGLGLHPDDEAEDALARLREQPRTWTVLGLRDNDTPGKTLIAGVLPGQIVCQDTDPRDKGGYERVGEVVTAADPEVAEWLGYRKFEHARDEG